MNEWIKELSADLTYEGVDVKREYGKMANWCKVNNKIPTRRRFINWLNRAEPTRNIIAPNMGATSYTSVKRKVREPSDEEFRLAGELARAELEHFRRRMNKTI